LLEHDIQQRYLQIRNAVERGAATLNSRDRKFFEDYSSGVNAFINSHRNKLPLEFRILQYQPKPWRVTDSLLVGANMSQMLNTQYDIELWREKIVKQLSPDLTADLYPNHSWRDHPPGADADKIDDQAPAKAPNGKQNPSEKPRKSLISDLLV